MAKYQSFGEYIRGEKIIRYIKSFERCWNFATEAAEALKPSHNTGSPKLPTLEECIDGIVSFDNKGLSPYDGAKLMYDYICRQLRAGA